MEKKMEIDVVIVGAPRELVEAIREQLKKEGRDDVNVVSKDAAGVVEYLDSIAQGEEDCPLCEAAAEARMEGRNVYVHRDIKMDDEGYVKDKVRHRLFKSPKGDVLFFDDLFHPMHELHLFANECERGAQAIYGVKPVLDADGDQLWQVMDWSDGKREVNLDHCGGLLENMKSQQQAKVSLISGPSYEAFRAEAMAKLNG